MQISWNNFEMKWSEMSCKLRAKKEKNFLCKAEADGGESFNNLEKVYSTERERKGSQAEKV